MCGQLHSFSTQDRSSWESVKVLETGNVMTCGGLEPPIFGFMLNAQFTDAIHDCIIWPWWVKSLGLVLISILQSMFLIHLSTYKDSHYKEITVCWFNTLRPRQNGRHFADHPFKRNFLNETLTILIKISLNFVPKGPINNNPALVEIMAWRWRGDKPLFQPMMVSLLTHICITRPQWVNLRWSK